MSENKFKSQNLMLQHKLRMNAETIEEKYPNIDHVDVEITIHFHTAVCKTESCTEITTLHPNSKIHVYRPCPNNDCTGSGFDLTSKLVECLRSEKIVEGVLICNGKEDYKYIHSTGCSCDTSCKYKLTPVLK